MKYCCIILLFCVSVTAQNLKPQHLSYAEFLGYVQKYHPVVRQANLKISEAQALLMIARGGFDPKIEFDFDQKEFKDKAYYSIFNSSFKIPTWYGVEVKAGFDNSEGLYLNPEQYTPNGGLTSLGVTVPVGQGLFINKRMADLRAAKLQFTLNEAERKLAVTDLICDASAAYLNWKKHHQEVKLYDNYLQYAVNRYQGVAKLIEAGDKPAIDSIEAGIAVNLRQLNYLEAQLKLAKARFELANFLWIDNIPVELQEHLIPDDDSAVAIAELLLKNDAQQPLTALRSHPKIISLTTKLASLEIERSLKANMLLPKLDVGYHYLSEPATFSNYRTADYKVGVNFSFPLFLRKERASLQLSKLKLQDSQIELELATVILRHKIAAQQVAIQSVAKQKKLTDQLVVNNRSMLNAEERLFLLGESSLFLINARENNLVNTLLSQINIENRYLHSQVELFRLFSDPDAVQNDN